MKTKPKRIRAVKAYGGEDLSLVISSPTSGWTEPVYILRQSDIRALAEQLLADFALAPYDAGALGAMAHDLKRAGMTPGKGNQ